MFALLRGASPKEILSVGRTANSVVGVSCKMDDQREGNFNGASEPSHLARIANESAKDALDQRERNHYELRRKRH